MYCKTCGNLLADGETICNVCGDEITGKERPAESQEFSFKIDGVLGQNAHENKSPDRGGSFLFGEYHTVSREQESERSGAKKGTTEREDLWNMDRDAVADDTNDSVPALEIYEKNMFSGSTWGQENNEFPLERQEETESAAGPELEEGVGFEGDRSSSAGTKTEPDVRDRQVVSTESFGSPNLDFKAAPRPTGRTPMGSVYIKDKSFSEHEKDAEAFAKSSVPYEEEEVFDETLIPGESAEFPDAAASKPTESVYKFDFNWDNKEFPDGKPAKTEEAEFVWSTDGKQVKTQEKEVGKVDEDALNRRMREAEAIFSDDGVHSSHAAPEIDESPQFTFNKNNETFQELLDEEFERIQKGLPGIGLSEGGVGEDFEDLEIQIPESLVDPEDAIKSAEARIEEYLKKSDLMMQEAMDQHLKKRLEWIDVQNETMLPDPPEAPVANKAPAEAEPKVAVQINPDATPPIFPESAEKAFGISSSLPATDESTLESASAPPKEGLDPKDGLDLQEGLDPQEENDRDVVEENVSEEISAGATPTDTTAVNITSPAQPPELPVAKLPEEEKSAPEAEVQAQTEEPIHEETPQNEPAVGIPVADADMEEGETEEAVSASDASDILQDVPVAPSPEPQRNNDLPVDAPGKKEAEAGTSTRIAYEPLDDEHVRDGSKPDDMETSISGEKNMETSAPAGQTTPVTHEDVLTDTDHNASQSGQGEPALFRADVASPFLGMMGMSQESATPIKADVLVEITPKTDANREESAGDHVSIQDENFGRREDGAGVAVLQSEVAIPTPDRMTEVGATNPLAGAEVQPASSENAVSPASAELMSALEPGKNPAATDVARTEPVPEKSESTVSTDTVQTEPASAQTAPSSAPATPAIKKTDAPAGTLIRAVSAASAAVNGAEAIKDAVASVAGQAAYTMASHTPRPSGKGASDTVPAGTLIRATHPEESVSAGSTDLRPEAAAASGPAPYTSSAPATSYDPSASAGMSAPSAPASRPAPFAPSAPASGPAPFAPTTPASGPAPFAPSAPAGGPAPFAPSAPAGGSAPFAPSAPAGGPAPFAPSTPASGPASVAPPIPAGGSAPSIPIAPSAPPVSSVPEGMSVPYAPSTAVGATESSAPPAPGMPNVPPAPGVNTPVSPSAPANRTNVSIPNPVFAQGVTPPVSPGETVPEGHHVSAATNKPLYKAPDIINQEVVFPFDDRTLAPAQQEVAENRAENEQDKPRTKDRPSRKEKVSFKERLLGKAGANDHRGPNSKGTPPDKKGEKRPVSPEKTADKESPVDGEKTNASQGESPPPEQDTSAGHGAGPPHEKSRNPASAVNRGAKSKNGTGEKGNTTVISTDEATSVSTEKRGLVWGASEQPKNSTPQAEIHPAAPVLQGVPTEPFVPTSPLAPEDTPAQRPVVDPADTATRTASAAPAVSTLASSILPESYVPAPEPPQPEGTFVPSTQQEEGSIPIVGAAPVNPILAAQERSAEGEPPAPVVTGPVPPLTRAAAVIPGADPYAPAQSADPYIQAPAADPNVAASVAPQYAPAPPAPVPDLYTPAPTSDPNVATSVAPQYAPTPAPGQYTPAPVADPNVPVASQYTPAPAIDPNVAASVAPQYAPAPAPPAPVPNLYTPAPASDPNVAASVAPQYAPAPAPAPYTPAPAPIHIGLIKAGSPEAAALLGAASKHPAPVPGQQPVAGPQYAYTAEPPAAFATQEGAPAPVQPAHAQDILPAQAPFEQNILPQGGVQPVFQPEATQIGQPQPGTEPAGAVPISPAQPELLQPGAMPVGQAQPELLQPGAMPVGQAQPELLQPGVMPVSPTPPDLAAGVMPAPVSQPGASHGISSGAAQIHPAQPELPQPGAVLISPAQPELPQPGAVPISPTQPELPQSGAVPISPAQPELPQPGAAQVHPAQPELSQAGPVPAGQPQVPSTEPGLSKKEQRRLEKQQAKEREQAARAARAAKAAEAARAAKEAKAAKAAETARVAREAKAAAASAKTAAATQPKAETAPGASSAEVQAAPASAVGEEEKPKTKRRRESGGVGRAILTFVVILLLLLATVSMCCFIVIKAMPESQIAEFITDAITKAAEMIQPN